MPRDRKGRFTAERTTTTVTERVTIDHDDTQPINWAPGWGDDVRVMPDFRAGAARRQRAAQVERCADFLALWAASAQPSADPPDRLIAEAAIILRAGPGASPLELTLGRIA